MYALTNIYIRVSFYNNTHANSFFSQFTKMFSFIVFILFFTPSSSLSSRAFINEGSSLYVEKTNETILSPNGVYSAGFYPIGDNAFIFAVWFTKSLDRTVIWSANRDRPVNGKSSKIHLNRNGNLVLKDAGINIVWSTETNSNSPVQLSLQDTGDLIIINNEKLLLWQSFDYPTNTLLPTQIFSRNNSVISSKSQTDYSSGFYKLFFDNDNVLKLLYNGLELTSIYWPHPWLMTWDAGRNPYNNSKIAVLDIYGHFLSSDYSKFIADDFGQGPHRRLTLDIDGVLRLYSLRSTGNWTVTWQSTFEPCMVQGICGPNTICSYFPDKGRGCYCLPGYESKDLIDLSHGCKLRQNNYRDGYEVEFANVDHVEYFGYEYDVFTNTTVKSCKEKCSNSSVCKGFIFKFVDGVYNCYAKSQLLFGKHSPNLIGSLYVKLNVSRENGTLPSNQAIREMKLNCSGEKTVRLDRLYKIDNRDKILDFLVYFASGIGALELLIIFTISTFIFKTSKEQDQRGNGYSLAVSGFRRFSYSELKKATVGFSEEIGRGGNGIVYRGVLPDKRVAAVKRLNDTNGGEMEFLAELSIIGRLNHMNLIRMWGYCIEGKHQVLVSEYMEKGSLAENLYSNKLDCEHRFNIAVGIAKGLAYLHEECLEWVLHCDVKPQNILLDSNYQPKVADFGLSKLLNRGGLNSKISTIRGTRGYMAPEWIFNLPITSKVDVYSYGIVVLELITGKSPMEELYNIEGNSEENGRMVNWVRKKTEKASLKGLSSWIEEVMDPNMVCGEYEFSKIQILVGVAMQCVEEDKDARPTMSKVVEMLGSYED